MGCAVAFFGMLLGEHDILTGSPAFSERIPIMFTPTSQGTLLLSMEYKSLMGI